ncbi:MAG TPA: hypothetical protein VMT93_07740 [Gemmatimonadaceae bacterium]|nr:hypothetical protein [Gemmatimonadaceae bacterium]
MRTVRWLASGLALIALTPSAGHAQEGRLFRDSWFWGVNAGVMNISSQTVSNQTATTVSGEWFITRTRGGLYLSAGESFFTINGTVNDNLGNPYNVQIKDMTQVMVDAIALPVAWGGLHLYAGGGFILNLVHSATVTDTILNPNVKQQVTQNLNNQKDCICFNILAGLHYQMKRAAIFGNIIWMPTPYNFVLSGNSAWMLQGGIRFNFGPSDESNLK